MFSEPALKQFKEFLAVDAKTSTKSKTPPGAFDVVSPALRKKLARDEMPRQKPVDARSMTEDDDEANSVENGKRGDVDRLIQLVSELCGGDKESMDRFFQQLERSFPGSIGEMSNVGEEDDLGEDEPTPFKNMPKPGGTLYGEDSYSRFFPEASHIKENLWAPIPPSNESLMAMDEGGDNSYLEMFPETARIKNLY
jgi:hypothetical protein